MANTIEILISGKDQFSPKARGAQRSAKGLGGAMNSLGKTALAAGAGFVAAQVSIAGVQKIFSSTIGAAAKFEAQLAQIRALTGATKEDTNLLSGAIKDMAQKMPKSPAELGAGAYFILSSGIDDAAEAAGVLEIAAKASTIGLGETEQVADALTTVINAYGLSAGDAAHVTDVMIEAVKQGKAEADAFAGVLGRVVPLAAQMGINFEEVSANLATFTLLGVSAEEAATGLRAVMVSLLNPTSEAEEVMAELGLSAESLRKQIKEKGLLATLDAMTKATGGNQEALAKLFPNIRALTSVLGTAGVQLDSYTDILAATNNATGNLEEGFAIVSETVQFKMQLAVNQLNVVMMELGTEVLPLVASAATATSDAIAVLAAIVAAARGDLGGFNIELAESAEALLDIAGSLPGPVRDLKKLKDAAKGVDDIGLEATLHDIGDELDNLPGPAGIAGAALKAAFGAGGEAPVAIENTQGELDGLQRKAAEMAAAMESEVAPTAVSALEDIAAAADDARDPLRDMFRVPTQEEKEAELVLARYRLELGNLELASEGAADVEGSRAAKLKSKIIPAAEDAVRIIGLQKDVIVAVSEAQDSSLPSMDAYEQGIEDATDAVADFDQKERDAIENALKPYEDELFEQQRVLKDVRDLTDEQTAAMARGEEEYLKQVDIIPQVTGLTRDQFFALDKAEQAWIDENRAIRDGTGASEAHRGELKLLTDNLNTDLRPQIRGYTDDLNRIPASIATTIAFDIVQLTQRAGNLASRQHGGPVAARQAVLVGERRPEIFVPDTAGTILPDARAVGGGGGGEVNIFAIDVEALADALMPHIRRAEA